MHNKIEMSQFIRKLYYIFLKPYILPYSSSHIMYILSTKTHVQLLFKKYMPLFVWHIIFRRAY